MAVEDRLRTETARLKEQGQVGTSFGDHGALCKGKRIPLPLQRLDPAQFSMDQITLKLTVPST
jgi:hypothetical protein